MREPGSSRLLLVLPAAVGTVVLAAIAFQAHGYRRFEAGRAKADRILTEHLGFLTDVTRFNQELAGIHRKVDADLARAGTGALEGAEAYRSHAEIVDRLARAQVALDRLSAQTPALEAQGTTQGRGHLQEQAREAQVDFADYRKLIVTATDLAATDPRQASRSLYKAGNAFLELADHSHRVAVYVSLVIQEREAGLASDLRRQMLREALVTGAAMVALLAAVLLVARYVARRAGLIVNTLEALGRHEATPALLKQVTALAGRGTLFGRMARSLLAFQDALAAESAARQAVGEERHRLRSIIDAMPDLVSLKDPQGRYVDCNPSYEALFGTRVDRILGRTNADFLPPDLCRTAMAADDEIRASGRSQRFAAWHTFAQDGHREYLEVLKTPMVGPDGAHQGILTVCRNLTPIWEAQRALMESQSFLSRAQALSQTGSWIIDLPEGGFRGSEEALALLEAWEREGGAP